MAKTNVNAVKASALIKSNSATNCSVAKPNITKPIVTYANSKHPHSVKINNYVQSKTLPAKRSTKSPNLVRIVQRPKSASERIKGSNLNKVDKDGDADNGTQSSDEDSEVCQAKLDSIRHRAIQRRQEDSNKGKERDFKVSGESRTLMGYLSSTDHDQMEKAAIFIQKMWRGYRTRNLNRKATNILQAIDMMRTNKYIQ